MRKTKIIATMGPATKSLEVLRQLVDAGVNVFRINMSHSSQAQAAQIIADIQSISDRVAILLDTKGPEVRTGPVDAPFELVTGETVVVRGEPGPSEKGLVRVDFVGLSRVLQEGTAVLIADGQIELEVTALEPQQLRCIVVRGGLLGGKKGVNIPGVRLPMPFMSEKDASDIIFGARHHVDFIAASFVSEAEDVIGVRELVEREGGHAAIIAKIESRYALKNLGDIVAVSDGLMVARGDLGVEVPLEEVPVVQKRIIDSCRSAGKTVIVATEMLESMITSPRPTRAETSDVANAIFEGADAVMLSGETSVGAQPVQVVEMMSRIARIAEAEVERRGDRRPPGGTRASEPSELICKGAWLAAHELNIKAILVPTSSGRTAKRMSRLRPKVPVLATTPDMAVARRLALSFGVFALPTRHFGRLENMVRRSCQLMVDEGLLGREDLIAVAAGVPVGRTGTTNLLTLQNVSAILGGRRERSS